MVTVPEFNQEAAHQFPNVSFFVGRKEALSAYAKSVQIGTRLARIAQLRNGFNPGNIRDHLIAHEKLGPEYEPMVTGRHVDRYSVRWEGWYVCYDHSIGERLSLNDTQGKAGMPRTQRVDFALRTRETYEGPKLLIRKTADTIIAALDEDTLFHDTLLHNVHLHRDSSLALPFVLAVLNARLTTTVLQAFVQKTGQTFAKVDIADLQWVPIRIMDFEHPTDEPEKHRLMERCRGAIRSADYDTPLALVKEALATHAALYGPAGKAELKEDPYWAEQIAQADPEFPGREDFVHDLLAMLAQRMMDLNKEKQGLIGRFETDLRGQADAAIHERLGKGKQGRTLYTHESCQPYVEDGSHTTHHLYETLVWSEEAFEDFVRDLVGGVPNLSDLLAVYGNYGDDYRRVTEALQKTDELIDRIVYALYGLTEEEIAIVEGSR